MLRIGIIGLGPDWEAVYRPALERLSQRLRVTAVYDAVTPRSERVGDELRAAAVPGIRRMLERADVRAVLCLDGAWHGLTPLRFAVDHRKPMYVANPLSAPLTTLEALCRRASGESVLLSPELRARTAPVTTRAQELAATRLGTVDQVDAEFGINDEDEFTRCAVAAVDWCTSLLKSHPVACRVTACEDDGLELHVSYRRTGSDRAPVSATIRIRVGPQPPKMTARLTCLHGTIHIHSETELHWQTHVETAEERLDRERGNVEVLLDHFARRVVGGLVPVAGLDDVCRILRLLSPYESLLHCGQQT